MAKGRGLSDVSPHPNPLPIGWGEGVAQAALIALAADEASSCSFQVKARTDTSPLQTDYITQEQERKE